MERPWLGHYEAPVPATLDYPPITIGRTLEDTVRRFPDRPALNLVLSYLGPLTIGARLTYREFDEEVNRFASGLAALGVRRGDRIAIMLPNLPQVVISFYAAMKLGAIVVNTNPMYTAHEIRHNFADSGCETVILLSGAYERLKQIQAATRVKHVIIADVADYIPAPLNKLVYGKLRRDGVMAGVPDAPGIYRFRELIAAHPEQPPQVDAGPDDTALFQYTGGTTGVPKAAMLSHCNVVANLVQLRHWYYQGKDGAEVMMGAIPFFHVYGMTVCMALAVYMGARLVIVPNPRDTEGVMKVLQREKCTAYPGVPAMYVAIINHANVHRYNLRSITACLSGSAPLPMEVQLKFGEITGGRLVEGYGLTEAAPVTHVNPIWGERRSGSIGLPLPDLEARIVDYDTLQDKPVGEAGELWLRGPQVMQGYWHMPEETAKTVMPGGWLRTGDIARMDTDGYFYIVDRLKDIIIVGGFNVLPREVEEVLFEHPKVQDAVVAGIPDQKAGELVKAYVVLKPGVTATPQELIAFCRERLTPYKVPRQVEFRAELPKTMVGKVLRRVLVEEEKRKQGQA